MNVNPGGLNVVNKILGLTGPNISSGLAATDPGVGRVRQGQRQLMANPPTAMAGGGALPTGPLQQFERSARPSMTLPLIQGEAGRVEGLAGAAGEASSLASGEQNLKTSTGSAISEMLANLLQRFNVGPGGVSTGAGGAQLISTLLGL